MSGILKVIDFVKLVMSATVFCAHTLTFIKQI